MSNINEMTMKLLRQYKLQDEFLITAMADQMFEELILLVEGQEEKELRNLFYHGVREDVSEYFDLVNRYAVMELGYELSQEEVDAIVSICDGYDKGNWGEEHLQVALSDYKQTLKM